VEHANAVIEQYLRCYCSSAQTDWCFYLSLCEIAYNDSMHKSNGKTLFFANFGFNPCCNINSPPVLLKESDSILTCDWAAHFDSLKQHLIKSFGDNRKSSSPQFNINDKIWLMHYYFINELSKKTFQSIFGTV